MRRLWTLLFAGVGVVALTAAVLFLPPPRNELPGRAVSATAAPAPVPADPTRESWRWRTESLGEVEPITMVVAAGAGVVAVTEDGTLAGIDGGTGRELWKRQTFTDRKDGLDGVQLIEADPAGDLVVGWDFNRMSAFDAFSGQPLWQVKNVEVGRAEVTTSTVIVAIGDIDQPKRLSALDLDTGAEAWSYDPPEGCGLIAEGSPLTTAEDTAFVQLVCAGDTSLAVALDAASGEELWRRKLSDGGAQWGAVQPVGNGAVALTIGHRQAGASVVAVDQQTGQDLGITGPDPGFVEGLGPGGLEVVTASGLQELGAAEPRWRFPVTLDYRPKAVSFSHYVARLDEGCEGKDGASVVLYEARNGVARRSLGCFVYPTGQSRYGLVPAPGALVVLMDDTLVGYA